VEPRIIGDIGGIDASAWNALVDATPDANPFVRHEWLAALEQSGCATPSAGWRAHHLALFQDGVLAAAMPLYEKRDSDGDFSRDWGWADAAARAGFAYYPKLVATVPFTPVGGARLLTASGVDRAEAARALAKTALVLARELSAGSIHVLFPTDAESRLFEDAGLARRIAYQFHFHNHGYKTVEDLLARFDSKRRNTTRRERAAPAKAGISIRTVRGAEMAADPTKWARIAHALHRSTVDKLMWGRRWLNEDFYLRAFTSLPGPMELVLAEREGKVVAGAFNVSSATRLFGRYWGCFEEHPFLHFNVCLYHSIDDVIARGLSVMEGGAGGEHKIPRGFEPTETFSSHLFLDKRLDLPLRRHIASEADERAEALADYRQRSPIFKRDTLLPTKSAK
jgi:predicted N-acyltransferase